MFNETNLLAQRFCFSNIGDIECGRLLWM